MSVVTGDPGLPPDETRAAGALLSAAWGERAAVLTAEALRDRTHVFRLRLLAWLRSFAAAAGRTGTLPPLRALAAEMDEVLSRRWPQARVPEYPALAGPDAVLVQVPDWWQPEG